MTANTTPDTTSGKTLEQRYRELDCTRLVYQRRLREVSAELGRMRAGNPDADSIEALRAGIEKTLFVCMNLYGDTLTATESGEWQDRQNPTSHAAELDRIDHAQRR